MFGKIITAIVTPFDENKNIDYRAFGTLLKKLEKEHTDSFVVCGTTGEAPTLSFKEKLNLFHFAKKIVNKETKIIAGVGTNNTAETIKQIKILNETDVDAYLVVCPYYNKPSQEGLYMHFKLIDEVSTKPIILYNVLSRCGVEINIPTLIRLFNDCNNIVGLKHASTNMQYIASIKKELPRLLVYGGEDRYILDVFKNHGDGIISVLTNFYGNEVYELIQDYLTNHFENISLYEYIQTLAEIIFIESSPAPIKYILYRHHLILNQLRLPLVTLSTPFKQLIDNILD